LKFREFEEEVVSMVSSAILRLGYPAVDVEVSLPPDESLGDLSSSAPLRLARVTGKKPEAIAAALANEVSKSLKSSKLVGSVTPHPSGYLNFTLKYGQFAYSSLQEVLSGGAVGSANRGSGVTVAIEHTNVNPNKALHIGHARNLVLGDSLARAMKHAGYSVQVLDYIDDSGAQVADIIVGFMFLGMEDKAPQGVKFDVYCGDSVYVRVNQEYLKDSSLKQKQSLVLREIESGRGSIAEYTRKIVERILSDQLLTCWRLGASYDLLNWESHIVHSGMWARVFEEMKENGLARLQTEGENAGCWVFDDPETGGEKVLVRSDGTAVYVAKDIPYAAWKLGLVPDPFQYSVFAESQPDGRPLWTTSNVGVPEHPKFGSADLAISVIDVKQSYLQRIVAKVLERLKHGSGKRYIHRGYEVVALSRRTASQLGVQMEGDFVHMSGRKGVYVNVDAALDALKSKAKEETRKRNPGEEESWIDDVAEAIAVAALRYELVKQDPDKIIVFDLDESLRFEGDTGPYLQYTYARARRILEKAGESPSLSVESAERLTHPLERELVKKVSMLDKAVLAACQYLSPKEVAQYCHQLSVLFNEYYEKVQVIREPDQVTRNGRLLLVSAFSTVLSQGMELLGIPRRERI